MGATTKQTRSPSLLQGEKICSKCKVKKPVGEFSAQKKKLSDGSIVFGPKGRCKDCSNEDYKERYRRSASRYKETKHRYYNSESGQKTIKKYERSERGLKRHRRYRARLKEKERMNLLLVAADVPNHIVKPYVEIMYNEFKVQPNKSSGKFPGLYNMGRALGLDDKTLYGILNDDKKKVSLDILDKLALYGDFSLDDIYDETKAWAESTGSPWPKGFEPPHLNGKRKKKKCK